jgi:CRP-like cAMP-binding protein
MPKTKPPAAPHGNRLLARLPPEEYQRLLPRLQLVPLKLKHVLYEARSPIDYAYFPNRSVVSALTVMEDGRAIEVATIGDEGMVGLPLLVEARTTANRVIVQVPGENPSRRKA